MKIIFFFFFKYNQISCLDLQRKNSKNRNLYRRYVHSCSSDHRAYTPIHRPRSRHGCYGQLFSALHTPALGSCPRSVRCRRCCLDSLAGNTTVDHRGGGSRIFEKTETRRTRMLPATCYYGGRLG